MEADERVTTDGEVTAICDKSTMRAVFIEDLIEIEDFRGFLRIS
jgi:hypothetical protein